MTVFQRKISNDPNFIFASTLLQTGICNNAEDPSALAHRAKNWEAFQHDIQKRIVILPQGDSDMLFSLALSLLRGVQVALPSISPLSILFSFSSPENGNWECPQLFIELTNKNRRESMGRCYYSCDALTWWLIYLKQNLPYCQNSSNPADTRLQLIKIF